MAAPARAPGFALIRLLRAGICNTDLELQHGYYGFSGVPGHEFVGEVMGADTPALVGLRVAGEINLACGGCDRCRQGLGRHCPHRTVLGIVKHPGAFAEFLTLPESNLHVVPDSISESAAVFIEPLAAACEILEQVRPPCNAEIAVLGDGKLGLLVSQALAAHGYRVRQFGRHPEKLRIAAAAGVATGAITGPLPRAAFEWVVEATGSADGLRQAVEMTRPRGTVILKSTVHGDVKLDAAAIVVSEVSLIGSRCGRFEPAIDLLRSGAVSVDAMISGTFPLSEAPRAFEQAATKGTLKILLVPE
jgi:alcohol dehydrogenase